MNERIAETEVMEIATDVLVIGGGLAGLSAASGLSSAGYPVILIEKNYDIGGSLDISGPVPGISEEEDAYFRELEEKVAADSRIEILTQTSLKKASGAVGDFELLLEKGDDIIERTVGAVVVAGDTALNPLQESYGVELSETILTQSGLEEIMTSKGALEEKFTSSSVALFTGLSKPSSPLALERTLRSALELNRLKGCGVYVFADDLKVAAPGLSRLYKQTRDEGVTFFKLTELPGIRIDDAGVNLSFTDPVLRDKIDLFVAHVVVDEEILPDPAHEFIAEAFHADMNSCGFLQTDNVHRFPVETNVKGVFVAGPAREVMGVEAVISDVSCVVAGVRSVLGDGEISLGGDIALVDVKKCAFCLTCYRCCPHNAVSWNGESAFIVPQACQGCGICASECPQDAIQVGAYADDAIKSAIVEAIATEEGGKKIVAFCCMNSAFEAYEAANSFGLDLPKGLKVVKVPCAGKIDAEYILSTFAKGADGVVVFACHDGNCKSENGSKFAQWRVRDIHDKLAVIGLEKERLAFATVSSNMGVAFASAVNEVADAIK